MSRGVKFRRDSDEEVCCKVVPGTEERYAELGGIACMRTAGHTGECIGLARDAARADGVCHCCRVPVGQAHRPDCYATEVQKVQ